MREVKFPGACREMGLDFSWCKGNFVAFDGRGRCEERGVECLGHGDEMERNKNVNQKKGCGV